MLHILALCRLASLARYLRPRCFRSHRRYTALYWTCPLCQGASSRTPSVLRPVLCQLCFYLIGRFMLITAIIFRSSEPLPFAFSRLLIAEWRWRLQVATAQSRRRINYNFSA